MIILMFLLGLATFGGLALLVNAAERL